MQIAAEYTIALYKNVRSTHWKRYHYHADTKFEFGLDENGNIVLGDEMLTRTARFWQTGAGRSFMRHPSTNVACTRLADRSSGQ